MKRLDRRLARITTAAAAARAAKGTGGRHAAGGRRKIGAAMGKGGHGCEIGSAITASRPAAVAAVAAAATSQRGAGDTNVAGFKRTGGGARGASTAEHVPGAHAGGTVAAPSSESSNTYEVPPQAIRRIVEAPPTPMVSFSPCRTKILQLFRPPTNPPLAEFVRDEIKLAGVRFDPGLRAASKMTSYLGMTIVPLSETVPARPGTGIPVSNLPEDARVNYVSWSPDGRHIAFALRKEVDPKSESEPFSLWVADSETGKARQLLDTPEHFLNSMFATYAWVTPDVIIAAVVPQSAKAAPKRPSVPAGPYIQTNDSSESKQSRTYPDLLKDDFDSETFLHYASSDLVLVKLSTGEVTRVSKKAKIHTGMGSSPDGKYIIVSSMEMPFSFSVPCGRFPKRIELWSAEGQMLREVAYLPLAEDIPIAFNSCRKGPRSIGWRSDKPSSLSYVVAQDGGDPAVDVSPRDVVYSIEAADFVSGGEPRPILETDLRFNGITWCDDDLAFAWESWWKDRRSIWSKFSPGRPEKGKEVVFDRNYEDVYSDPGDPVTRRTKDGTYVLATFEEGRYILLQGEGCSPKGNHPFLDLYDFTDGSTKRLWESKDPYYESIGSLMCDGNGRDFGLQDISFLMSRESQQDPTQYYMVSWPDGLEGEMVEQQITDFPHPYPELRDLTKKIIRYKRNDGVDLTATLYLPPGYDAERDGPLPCLLWAYPREFKSKATAGQVRRSFFTFSHIGGMSPLLWLARKYAILDGPTMPIVGEGEEEPNDTYIEQLVASAEAAVNEAVRIGVAEKEAVAIGGHSYGTFMAANLLAHAPNLFCCGIARSGAYNRTLTPFGFQNEQRTIWQARDTYMEMSPYLFAHKIEKPLLLIHGDDDNNSGTSKIQSERFFSALKGHGVPSKLVLLPHESHSYRAQESVMHCLYEMDQWLQKYCEERKK